MLFYLVEFASTNINLLKLKFLQISISSVIFQNQISSSSSQSQHRTTQKKWTWWTSTPLIWPAGSLPRSFPKSIPSATSLFLFQLLMRAPFSKRTEILCCSKTSARTKWGADVLRVSRAIHYHLILQLISETVVTSMDDWTQEWHLVNRKMLSSCRSCVVVIVFYF